MATGGEAGALALLPSLPLVVGGVDVSLCTLQNVSPLDDKLVRLVDEFGRTKYCGCGVCGCGGSETSASDLLLADGGGDWGGGEEAGGCTIVIREGFETERNAARALGRTARAKKSSRPKRRLGDGEGDDGDAEKRAAELLA